MPSPSTDTQPISFGAEFGQQPCPSCGFVCDVSHAAPLQKVTCKECGKVFAAKNKVDNYTLLSALGHGASGRVYLAEDANLNRKVAIKILRSSFESSPTMWSRLDKEAKLAASVHHENVVSIFRLGRIGRRPYMVMEYLENATLERYFDHPPPDEKTLREIAVDVLEGLSAAAEKGLVHGDVKPANLLVDGKGRTKVGDFGLARLMSREEDVECKGTPFYMAPEIISRTEDSFQSDMYSLGATLYHLATGKPPFPGETSEEVMRRAVRDPIPSLQEQRPDLSKSFCDWLERMMEKDPKNRFANHEEALYVVSKGTHGQPRPRAKLSDWLRWLFLD